MKKVLVGLALSLSLSVAHAEKDKIDNTDKEIAKDVKAFHEFGAKVYREEMAKGYDRVKKIYKNVKQRQALMDAEKAKQEGK